MPATAGSFTTNREEPLYDPDVMPAALRRAHRSIDEYVDSLYQPEGFATAAERVAHLLHLHKQISTSPAR
ncbi:MAG: type IIL restriction-modification enzyme MmeI [Microbacterium sp.]